MNLKAAIAFYYKYIQVKRFTPAASQNVFFRLGYFDRFIGERDVQTISLTDVQGFLLSEHLESLQRSTYNHYISVLRKFFGYLHATEVITKNPAITLEFVREEQKVIEYFTLDEVRMLLEVRYPYQFGPVREFQLRDLLIIHIGALLGLRSSEARKLQWKDVNLEYGEVTVRQGKNLKDRIVPMLPITKDAFLKTYMKKKPQPDDFVLYGWHGKSTNKEILNDILKRLCAQAGIKKEWIHFHILRHTCATLFLRGKPGKRGMDIRVVQELLGHANITSTQKYTHVDKGFLRDEMKRTAPKLQ